MHNFNNFFLLSLSVSLVNNKKYNNFENTQFIESNPSIYLLKIILSFITTYLVSIQLYNKFEKKFI